MRYQSGERVELSVICWIEFGPAAGIWHPTYTHATLVHLWPIALLLSPVLPSQHLPPDPSSLSLGHHTELCLFIGQPSVW